MPPSRTVPLERYPSGDAHKCVLFVVFLSPESGCTALYLPAMKKDGEPCPTNSESAQLNWPFNVLVSRVSCWPSWLGLELASVNEGRGTRRSVPLGSCWTGVRRSGGITESLFP